MHLWDLLKMDRIWMWQGKVSECQVQEQVCFHLEAHWEETHLDLEQVSMNGLNSQLTLLINKQINWMKRDLTGDWFH
jgi:hypothetical protein